LKNAEKNYKKNIRLKLKNIKKRKDNTSRILKIYRYLRKRKWLRRKKKKTKILKNLLVLVWLSDFGNVVLR